MKLLCHRVFVRVLAVCATTAIASPVLAQQGSAPSLILESPAFAPVEPPTGYARAITGETRSESGEPGSRYWQQKVDYRIEVTLDPETAILRGTATVSYTNNAPGAINGLVLSLYQNVFAPGAERNRPVRVTGGVNLARVQVDGEPLAPLTFEQLQALTAGEQAVGYTVEQTTASLMLPRPIPSGGSVELEFDWAARVPDATAFRTGHIDNEIFTVAQWYPQLAVVDDVYGFDQSPYLGDGEFYLEYGDYDVSITVPEGWLVGATGQLVNASEILPAAALRRLQVAVAEDTTVRVTSGSELAPGATVGAVRTWHFRAEQVRDFAFATSRRYVWDAVGAAVGGVRGRVTVNALYDPELEHWSEAAGHVKNSLEFFSRYVFPYPYVQATAAFGPVGGMEYPMLVFIGASAPGQPLFNVLAHELAHQWFPIVVGSPEAAYPWMDEGVSTFSGILAQVDQYQNQVSRLQAVQDYLAVAAREVEVPIMQHTDFVRDPDARTVAAYDKPAILLFALRRLIGGEVFDRALRRYAQSWSFKHPYPWDFFSIVEGESGRDLDWFWRAWFYETGTLDQSIAEVVPGSGSLRITVENRSGAVMPVELGIEFEDGTTSRVDWPVEVWAGTRRVTRQVNVDRPVVRVVIDPEQYYPDVDRSNNVWPEDSLGS